jgi:alkylation response protein AidB-like acyl-CoA dehydrogenase
MLNSLRQQVREFAEHEVAPRVVGMERRQGVETDLARELARQGWLGPTIPAGYGGMDLGHTAKVIIVEELARVSGAAGAIVQASQLGTAKLLHYGSRDQRETWLPQVACGTVLPTIAVTERSSGGHVLGMHTTACRRGRGWEINGAKAFVGNSHLGRGSVHGVVARTGPGSNGLTAFLVEAGRTGVALAPHTPALGLHGFSFGEIHFAGVRVPDDHIVGDIGQGLAVAYSSSVLYGRPQLAAVALGLHTRLRDETVAFAQRHRRYGKPLAALPTVKDKIGRIESALRSARTALYQAVRLLDCGQPCDHDLMQAKLLGTELLLDSVRLAMEIHAAEGLDAAGPLTRVLRDAYCIYAPAGTSDIQRLRLAEDALTHGSRRRPQWSEQHPGHWAHIHHPDIPGPAPAAS